jgi:hypothetical protein
LSQWVQTLPATESFIGCHDGSAGTVTTIQAARFQARTGRISMKCDNGKFYEKSEEKTQMWLKSKKKKNMGHVTQKPYHISLFLTA